MSRLNTWTTEKLKTEIRRRESPEYADARRRAGWSDHWTQMELDCLCEELGRREEC